MRHLIDPLDFSQQEIASLLDLADRICADPAAYQDVAAHKKLATLFYEPSTRTLDNSRHRCLNHNEKKCCCQSILTSFL